MAANVNATVSPEPLHPSLSVSLRLSPCLSASVIEIESCIYIEFGEGFSGGQIYLNFVQTLRTYHVASHWQNGKSMLLREYRKARSHSVKLWHTVNLSMHLWLCTVSHGDILYSTYSTKKGSWEGVWRYGTLHPQTETAISVLRYLPSAC